MCGISGIWSLDFEDIGEDAFNKFNDALTHRGPDGRGIYHDARECVRLGHRRLSILDLSVNGKQPMSYANERYWITFNGEIYNFLELRKELEDKGYSFKSDSDTEVILASYECFGEDCLFKFNGMWAFAIWDRIEKSLFLSRDRFGVKPLFYFFDGKKFAFASELKAFLALDLKLSFDYDKLEELIEDGNTVETTSATMLQKVFNLQAGHSAIFSRKGLKVKRWWNTLDHIPQVPDSYEEQVEAFRSLLIDACRLRMRSDVPIGSALSGGLDSSSVLSILNLVQKDANNTNDRIIKDRQRAFVAQFPGTSQDETAFAKIVVEHTGTQATYIDIDASALLSHLDKALFQFEGIFDLPIGPWLLYKEFRKNNVVISIDGHGADELLGGYHHHVETAMSDAFFPRTNPRRFLEIGKMWKGLYPEGSPVSAPTYQDVIKKSIKDSLKTVPLLRSLSKEAKIFNTCQDPRFKKMDRLNQRLFLDFHERSLPAILRNFDRCSMHHGVEIRAPFLDYRLVTFCFALQQSAKVGSGFTKRILRDAMKGILPESIRVRTSKVGFTNPLIEWFKGPLKPFVLDCINSDSFLTSPLWDGRKISDEIHKNYKNNNFTDARRAWQYIQADRLLQLFQA